jgi:hypothetical protein
MLIAGCGENEGRLMFRRFGHCYGMQLPLCSSASDNIDVKMKARLVQGNGDGC